MTSYRTCLYQLKTRLIAALLPICFCLFSIATYAADGYQPNGLIPVCAGAHFYACGLWDRAGQWRVEPRYHEIVENGNMWTVKLDSGRVGLLDAEGNVLIEPTFGEIGPFQEGLAYAQRVGGRDERYGFIDVHGQWVIEPQFMYPASFKEGLALVWVPGEKPGHDFEDRRMGWLDKTGNLQMMPYAEVADEAVDGRIVVMKDDGLSGSGEPRYYSIANAQGKQIVPWMRVARLTLIPGGGWLVMEAEPSKSTVVYGRNGKVLFKVKGEEAYIYHRPPEVIAAFTPDGHLNGLVNLQTGKVMMQPKPMDFGEVANGLVSFRPYAKPNETALWGYMTLSGKAMLPPSLQYAPAFESDVVASCNSDAKKPVCDVINRDLKRVDAFDQYEASTIWPSAWDKGPQTPALRNVLSLFVEPHAGQTGSAKLLVDTKGQLILRIAHEGKCDREVIYNAQHQAVWPHYPEATCEAINLTEKPAKNASPALIATYQEIQAFEHAQTLERAKLVNEGGGIENLLPEKAKARQRFQNLPWVVGPADISLANGEASLKLPEGYRYISAQSRKAALVAQTATDQAADNDVKDAAKKANDAASDAEHDIAVDLIAGPDFRWVIEVVAAPRGYVDLSVALPPAQDLLETRKVYQRGNPLKPQETDAMMADLMGKWVEAPEIDLQRQRLSYAYGSGYGSPEFNLIRFGRQTLIGFMPKWTSMFSRNDFDVYHDEIINLVDAVVILPGHAYADYQQGDPVAPFQLLEQLITGPPSTGFSEFSQLVNQSIARDEAKKQAKLNALLIKFGLIVLVLIIVLFSKIKR